MRTVTLPGPDWVEEVGPVDGLDIRAWDVTADLSDGSESSGGSDSSEKPDSSSEGVGAALPFRSAVTLVVPPMGPPPRLARLASLPNLEVLQLLVAGYDAALPYLPDGVTLCNAAGVHDPATAEFAVALILAAQRGIPQWVLAQERGEWRPPTSFAPALADRRVLIVGYGRIGRAIAARLAPFEVTLTAVASRERPGDEFVDSVHGIAALPELLPRHDIVVLVTPLTDATRGLVDAAFLAAMPDGALLVNIARGAIVDTDALLAQTSTGRLRAALDVTDPEPLPTGHPLWRTPGVLIAPHVGGAADSFAPRIIPLLRQQLRRYAAGQPLRHVVAGPGLAEKP